MMQKKNPRNKPVITSSREAPDHEMDMIDDDQQKFRCAKFHAWLLENGTDPAMLAQTQPHDFPDTGRGLRANRAFRPNEVMVRIPEKVLLRTDDFDHPVVRFFYGKLMAAEGADHLQANKDKKLSASPGSSSAASTTSSVRHDGQLSWQMRLQKSCSSSCGLSGTSSSSSSSSGRSKHGAADVMNCTAEDVLLVCMLLYETRVDQWSSDGRGSSTTASHGVVDEREVKHSSFYQPFLNILPKSYPGIPAWTLFSTSSCEDAAAGGLFIQSSSSHLEVEVESSPRESRSCHSEVEQDDQKTRTSAKTSATSPLSRALSSQSPESEITSSSKRENTSTRQHILPLCEKRQQKLQREFQTVFTVFEIVEEILRDFFEQHGEQGDQHLIHVTKAPRHQADDFNAAAAAAASPDVAHKMNKASSKTSPRLNTNRFLWAYGTVWTRSCFLREETGTAAASKSTTKSRNHTTSSNILGQHSSSRKHLCLVPYGDFLNSDLRFAELQADDDEDLVSPEQGPLQQDRENQNADVAMGDAITADEGGTTPAGATVGALCGYEKGSRSYTFRAARWIKRNDQCFICYSTKMDNFDFLCTYGFTCLRKAFFDVEKYRKFVLQFVLQDQAQDEEPRDAEVCPHAGRTRVNMILSVLQLHGLLCQENWFVDLTPSSSRKTQKNNAVTDGEVVVEDTTNRLERYRSVFSPALFTLFFLNAQYYQLCHQINGDEQDHVEGGGTSVLPTLQHSPDSATLSSSTSKATTSKKRKNYATTNGTQQLLHGKKRQENRSCSHAKMDTRYGTTRRAPSFPCGGGAAQVQDLDLESQLEIAYELAAGSTSRFISRSTGAGATTSSSTTLLEQDFNVVPTSTPSSCLEKMVEHQAKKLIQKLLRDEYDYEEGQVLVREIEKEQSSRGLFFLSSNNIKCKASMRTFTSYQQERQELLSRFYGQSTSCQDLLKQEREALEEMIK
ncbi:unnamed protein product [Amoebophrya sp. A120]|nr:unnamed protein product [Amoebophrya sp. A120]|eukprot:GSA120T00013871001.1